jgi:flavin reductase (DIM6/NTAB) family NADH-FMN oxidoreductase RutF
MNLPEPQRQLGAALGRIPSGIFVLTVRHGGRETGMLASWVQQCSFEPPQVTAAVKRGRYVGDWLAAGAPFTINILDETQTDMVSHFGRGFDSDEPAFEGLEVQRRPDAAPVLEEALAYLDCQCVASHPAGDHTLFIARVLGGRLLADGRPMVHVRKSGFHY